MATNQQGPNPFSLIRAASIAQSQLQSVSSQGSGTLQRLVSQGSQDLGDFVWPEADRPTIPHNDFRRDRELPVVDLAGLLGCDGDDEQQKQLVKARIAKRVADACAQWGFFQLINHDVPLAVFDEVHHQAYKFFELPMEQKQRAMAIEPGSVENVYGYGLNTAGYKYAGRPWIERFQCSWSPSSNLSEQAQLLLDGQELEDFRSAMEAYCEGAEKVAKLTLELCAIGLGVSPDTFGKHMEPSQSIARLNYYPACPTPSLTLGLGAHTDPYTLTLLHQCQVGGLQVCKDKKWITVKPRRDAFVVNVGDNLQAWSNGKFKSVEHRAVLNDKVPRLSLVFFYAPPFETEISAPDAIVGKDGRRRFRSFTWGEYLEFLKTQKFEKDKNQTWLQAFAL